MTSESNRRGFMAGSTSTIAATIAATQLASATSQSLFAQADSSKSEPKRLVIGMMGLSRGKELTADLLKLPGVVIKYACDTDSARAASGAKLIAEAGGDAKPIQDFRTILDDKEVDAFFCAAPNHWHGPAAILGCKALKHVYVEKPACHNPQEGEWMVAAAEKYGRCVQVGTQRRSSSGFQEAIAKLKDGAIGNVYMSRAFFQRLRGSIGTKTDANPPATLDYALWQGPAPRKPFRENVVPYNWHWFWHWGNGELGNNGVHSLDICRWGLGVDFPIKTVSSGGKYMYQDDQETPDTQTVSWEFEGGKQITYQGLSRTQHLPGPFVSFYGTEGYLEIDAEGAYTIYDVTNKKVQEVKKSGWGQIDHITNFLEAVRANDPSKLNQPILSGHKSTLLCHLGNIAHRSNSVVLSDAKDGHLADKELAAKYWKREYDADWEKQISTI